MRECLICGRTDTLERHHIFAGARRKHSDMYNLVVDLCPKCHRGTHGVHHDKKLRLHVQRLGQTMFELDHTHDEFMRIFGKNYL